MATYVYAIVRRNHDVPASLRGVAETGLRTLPVEEVAAVVGDAPEGLRARRRDVSAHHRVLEQLAGHGPVLPMRFGVVVPSDDDVAQYVSEYADGYRDALDYVDGRTELNVKAPFDVDSILPDLVRADPEILELRERSRERPDYQEQLRLGELVSRAVERYERGVADRIVEVLGPYADDVREGPAVEGNAANISFLVRDGQVDPFLAAVAGLRGDIGLGVELHCSGPIPAYSFVPATTAL